MTDFAALRMETGLTLAEVASGFGSTADRVTEWENGLVAPPAHVIRALRVLSEAATAETSPLPLRGRAASDAQQTFPWIEPDRKEAGPRRSRTGAFVDNMQLPIHRWFRYSAGFSAAWVTEIVKERAKASALLFDPFAGSGTSLLAAQAGGVSSAGAERHPFVHRIARAKLNWNVEPLSLRERGLRLLEHARSSNACSNGAALLQKCYSPEALSRLENLRQAYWECEAGDGDAIAELLWLALTSILRECSGVGTAQWQYILPNKAKARVSDPYVAFARRLEMFAGDVAQMRRDAAPYATELLPEDARQLDGFDHLEGRVSLVITSPPYPNNYDYADATRLEMTFWREIESWSDLQHSVRRRLIRSCSQHSAAERLELDSLLGDPLVEPIRNELSRVCRELATVRETKGGRKTYHTMVAAYFADLARVWRALRPLCAAGAELCFVIGDSAPYGVYVPVDHWLGDLAVAAGFHDPRFEKVRDRNVKWKNRKHRVPLKEGNLWLRG